MTASEQHAEYAAATPTVGKRVRAAIEADVLRRVADYLDGPFDPPEYRDTWLHGVADSVNHLRAEADRIEEGAR